MKNRKTEERQTWTLTIAVLAMLLLIGVAGCVKVIVKVTQTQATQSGLAYGPPTGHPSPSSGTFVPVQGPVPSGSSGATTTVCNPAVTVDTNKIVFQFTDSGQTLLCQTNATGSTGFQGYLVDTNTSQTIANTDYILQWYVTAVYKGCCTNVSGLTTDVGFTIQKSNYCHKFTAWFKPGHLPPVNHQIQLKGQWK